MDNFFSGLDNKNFSGIVEVDGDAVSKKKVAKKKQLRKQEAEKIYFSIDGDRRSSSYEDYCSNLERDLKDFYY